MNILFQLWMVSMNLISEVLYYWIMAESLQVWNFLAWKQGQRAFIYCFSLCTEFLLQHRTQTSFMPLVNFQAYLMFCKMSTVHSFHHKLLSTVLEFPPLALSCYVMEKSYWYSYNGIQQLVIMLCMEEKLKVYLFISQKLCCAWTLSTQQRGRAVSQRFILHGSGVSAVKENWINPIGLNNNSVVVRCRLTDLSEPAIRH